MPETRHNEDVLKTLMPLFDADVRSRGVSYARAGKVSFVTRAPFAYTARVAGMRLYNVSVQFGDGLNVGLFCTCPYFKDRGPCKHIWASLIEAQEFLFMSEEEFGESYFEPDNEMIEKGDDFDLNTPDDDLAQILQTAPSGRSARKPGWRRTMAQLRAGSGPADSAGEGILESGAEIHYMIDRQRTLQGGGVWIRIMTRRPRRNGTGWTKYRESSFSRNDVARLPDETDRRAITMLYGAVRDTYYAYSPDRQSSFVLTSPLINMILPVLAGSGRLVLSEDRYSREDARKLALDEGEPWHLELEVTKDEKQSSYVTKGYLQRNGERIPLSEPDLLLAEGWLMMNGVLAPFEYGGNFQWVCVLRKTPEIEVPAGDVSDWLSALLECRRPAGLHLPDDLHYTEELREPRPKLSLYTMEAGYGGSYLGGMLSFCYGDERIDTADVRRSIYDADRRVLVHRDMEKEASLVETLLELPFELPRQTAQWAYRQPVSVEIRSHDVPRAVTRLIEKGWEVDAEGVKYRRSGSFSINISSGTDWFDLEGHIDFDGVEVPMPEVLKAVRSGERMIRLGDGSAGVLPEKWLRQLELISGTATIKGENVRFAKTQAFLLDALLAEQPGVSWDDTFERLRSEIRGFSGIRTLKEPRSFAGVLREYQREGLGWFDFLQRFGFGGCLADDMGLGKTVQALALLEARRGNGAGPSLVVVPSSVVVNWMNEAERFVPELPAMNHTGTDRIKDADAMPGEGIVITSYAILRRDIEWLRNADFDYVILDEAQAIKNAKTATAKAARLLKASYRLAMSGTPIENHLGELWSLFEFLNAGMLGASGAFDKALSNAGLEVGGEAGDLLCRAVRPFIMRRTKEQVARELPEKHEETVFCELPTAQRKLYDELRDYYRQMLAGKIDGDGFGRSKIMVLEALLRLRQVACHPGLVDETRRGKSSAKLDLLLEQIEDLIAEGHKALVFSQFTTMLSLVRDRLDSRKIAYEYLDGRTRRRAERVERFQTDTACPVFLISLKAGGLGLNLTSADYVIVLDPWWNPAVEAQAIDRTHRIGQTQKVFAYRLVAKDTVEERILDLQQKKRKLADSIIKADSSLIRNLTREDLELLLS
ncbi:MAG: SNF2-related protein [Kiritimatiellia bacterium]